MFNSIKKIILKFIPVVVILISTPGFAQNSASFESWNSAQINYKLDKEWKLNFEEQFRFNNNLTKFDQLFSEVNAKYKYSKHISFGVGLRYSLVNDYTGSTKELEKHFRFHFDAIYKHDYNRFNFKYRLRYQRSKEIGKLEYYGYYPSNDVRLKIASGYNIKKWKFDPTASIELFYHSEIGALNGFEKYRFTVGTDYKINKNLKLNFTLIKQKQYRFWNPKSMYGLKIKAYYKIK